MALNEVLELVAYEPLRRATALERADTENLLLNAKRGTPTAAHSLDKAQLTLAQSLVEPAQLSGRRGFKGVRREEGVERGTGL